MIAYPPFPMTRLRVKTIAWLCTLSLWGASPLYASSEPAHEVLKLSSQKRLEAAICANSMNRIAVANDRITQIFGDEGTFESQNDEATGQIFLKPTLQNGSQNLSLTLITEQGVTQDLTLKPTAPSAQTIILGRDSSGGSLPQDGIQSPAEPALTPEKTLPLQEQLLTLIKQVLRGQLPLAEDGTPRPLPAPENYAITPFHSWSAGPYRVQAYLVKNESETSYELHEKNFYQPGDLALSFDTRTLPGRSLPPQGTVTLYVVSSQPRNVP